MKLKLLLFAIVALLFLSLTNCRGRAEENIQKGDFNVELLFEQDGCKVYRFRDGTRYVYWVNQTGKVNSDYMQGKAMVRMESITTDTSESDSVRIKLKELFKQVN